MERRRNRDGHAGDSSSPRNCNRNSLDGMLIHHYWYSSYQSGNKENQNERLSKFVKIFVGRIEMNARNNISSTSCTSGGEIEMVMLVTVVVLVAVVNMQLTVC